jgi:CheY-like chemotaxis protein
MAGAVLVVSDDAAVRDTVGEWLDSVGLEVMSCPGPTGPDYACVAGRDGGCALTHASDVVVLDAGVAGDAVMEGTSTSELLGYYRWEGRPVIVLARDADGRRLGRGDDGVLPLTWPADRDDVLDAILRAGRFGEARQAP